LRVTWGAAVLLLAAFLIGAASGTLIPNPWVYAGYQETALPGTRTATLWAYGIYSESGGSYTWEDAGRRIQAASSTRFFEQMGFPTGLEVDSRKGRVSVLVLNHLGARGWDLVEVRTAGAGGDVYWLKRPQ
jgi:hypothetical protein